jgi:NTE family protein
MRVGLSLGGGGAHGYAHIGAIRALEEAGIKVDLINGTSIGAVIGGAYALYSDLDKIVRLVEKIIAAVNVRYFNIFRFSGQMSQPVIRNWIASALGNVVNLRGSLLTHRSTLRALEMIFGGHEFRDTQIPFSAIATDLVTWKTVVIKEGRLTDGVLPSISIPGVFPPVARSGQLLVDGAVLANVPVSELRQEGADFVIAIRLPWQIAEGYQNGFDLLNRVELMKQNTLEQWQVDDADFVVAIDLPAFDILKFDEYKSTVALGYKTTKKALPQLKKRLGERNG